MKVRVLSLNTGLLELFGWSIPVPFVPQRLAALPGQLRAMDCDVVVLQEVYGDDRRRWLAESLSDVFPYAIYPRRKRRFGLENTLMVLSRFPASGDVELFSDASLDEAFFDSKGMLVTQLNLGDDCVLHMVNLHMTAGGLFRHPEASRTNAIRARQIVQVLDRIRGSGSPLMLAGDLNAGPGVSEGNFQQILDAGFVSVHDLVGAEVTGPTWHPKNPLNVKGPHRRCPPQRIDHLFVRSEDLASQSLRPISSTICLQEPVVRVSAGKVVTVSDHFGLCADLEVTSKFATQSDDVACGVEVSA